MRISDWSSDVCSSDLGEYQADGYFRTDFHSSQLSGQSRRFVVMTRLDDLARAVEATLFASDKPLRIMEIRHYAGGEGDVATALEKRSEERRGGKECVSSCRSRWSRYNKNKKKK